MDPISVAASVAGIAATSLQLSETIYELISTFYEAEKEMSSIANGLSLLAVVLRELEGILQQDPRMYRRRMVRVVKEILENCENIFQSISGFVTENPQNPWSSKQFQRRIWWYFQLHRVRPLQAGLESMKSTINVLLHVVNLARVTEAADSFRISPETFFVRAEVQKERKALVGVVLDNRNLILDLKQMERESHGRGQDHPNRAEDKQEREATDGDVAAEDSTSVLERKIPQSEKTALGFAESSEDKESKRRRQGKDVKQEERRNRNRRSRDASNDSNIPAPSVSHPVHVMNPYEISEPPSTDHTVRSTIAKDLTKKGHALSHPLMGQERSVSQSPVSEYYEMSPENPITEETQSDSPEDDVDTKPCKPQRLNGLATKVKKCPESPSDTEIVTPSAEWFLSVVPHESDVDALIVRPCPGQTTHLRTRAEETAKKLLLTWTNIDPDSITGDDSGSWDDAEISNTYSFGPAREARIPDQPYPGLYPPQAHPTYAPQQWYQPPVYTLPLSMATPCTPPHLSTERQTDVEELARLKKLILSEKAEQDLREAEVSAAVPFAAPTLPTDMEDFGQATTQHESAASETTEILQMPQEHGTLWKAEHPRLQPVIMKDWLGRKFIFPVDMCQTWEGLHNLIQGAFGHDLEYKPLVEKGKYLIAQVTGEYILPSTWQWFVEPGLEIRMEIVPYGIDYNVSRGKAMVGGKRDKVTPQIRIPLHAAEIDLLESPKTLQSGSDEGCSDEDVEDDDATTYSFSNMIGYVERSDPRYLAIEHALLEQKQAQIKAEMKLERNRRFFLLKQQLVDQGAAIQAREDAADHAEQETKLAWLEKQVRDLKDEHERLPPLLVTPPGSSAGDSMAKTSTGSPPERASFRRRLLGRIPSASLRSRGSVQGPKLITEG